jgi:carbonic anhydrase/acetyltransferase-like protein (isoleucine patch superfamily)
MAEPVIVEFGGALPDIHETAWVAPGATLVGAVRLAAGSSVWFGAVLRADGDSIEIGPGSNIQDGSVLHTDPGFPIVLGADVTVGHRAVLHGCTVHGPVLVGMGAVVLNGATVGPDSLLAAGTVVLENARIPPRSLVAGIPGKVRRELGRDEVRRVRDNAVHYTELVRRYTER